MSNIKSLRTDLRNWLSSLIRIDKVDLDSPVGLYSDVAGAGNRLLAANTLIEFPVENLSYSKENNRAVVGSGVFRYSLTYRYAEELSLHDLPISELESLVESIQALALINSPSRSIRNLTIEAVEYPVNPRRDGEEADDWLVSCNFSFNITFTVTELCLSEDFFNNPDIPSGFTLNSLTLKVNKSEIPVTTKPGTFVEDSNITIQNPN
ncbi:hypothetical protein H6F88_31690 [Oculatella sp. FACHB-28]|uniref:hypothetical protein n=1 Tax=Oculatella sp. FACHB-28 TaxID=2692845 RepID=UPI0016861493|nr:hypothetical protein [Oculatella sp. FACHB-28]MBD2060506.1 hypothetical protein [Oculatella sp. FACHB-28]